MKLDISARHFALTDAIRDYAEKRFAALEHLNPRITSAHVELDHDAHHSGKQYLVKAHFAVPGEVVNAEVHSADLYEGIDLTSEKLATQLRKLHDRQSARRVDADEVDAGELMTVVD